MNNEQQQVLNKLDKHPWDAADRLADAEPFGDKMARLTTSLGEQFKESARLETEIRKNLAGLGYEI